MANHKVLIFARYYIPGIKAGGPIRSIYNLSQLLKSDLSLKIVTSDRDYLDKVPYPNIEFDKWTGDDIQTYYNSKKIPIVTFIREIKGTKTVYLNSFFDPVYSILPLIIAILLKKKVVLAPRGELAKAALRIKKIKKKVYILTIKSFSICHKFTWHATNKQERDQINIIFGEKSYIMIADNISLTPIVKPLRLAKKDYLDLYFLGRIAKIKNLHFALEIIKELTFDVRYCIYGPIDNVNYWKYCQQLISRMPKNIIINYEGELQREEIEKSIKQHEFLFLPTQGENFGHAIAESLSYGIPVIISDKTPWTKLNENKAGWDLDLKDKGSFTELLNALSGIDTVYLNSLRKSTLMYYSFVYEKKLKDVSNNYNRMFAHK